MIQLRSLLRMLESSPTGKLELMSGRRPRILIGSEVKNLADEILTDEHVIDLCKQAAGDSRLDALAEAPVAWLASSPIGKIRVVAGMKGREVMATIVMVRDSGAREESEPRREPEPLRREPEPPRREPEIRREIEPSRKQQPEARGEPEPRQPERREDHRRERRSSRAAPAADPRRPSPAPDRPVRAPRRPSVEVKVAPEEARPPPPVQAPKIEATLHSPREPAFAPAELARPREVQLHSPIQGKASAKRVVPASIIELLRRARAANASDLHLGGGVVYARTPAGLAPLPEVEAVTEQQMQDIFDALLTERERVELQRTGGVGFAADVTKTMRVRVNATTTLDGNKLALRLLHASAPSFEDLGLPGELVRATDHPQGLVVITGPSGQGKTTTLSALVQHINLSRAAHVIMVEDPIEIPVSSAQSVVSQRQVGLHAKSFARALEGALRQDPDVIVIGELRDVETVRIALAASETGHLVLGSMNAPSTKSVIDRLIDLFPPADQPQVRHTLGGGLRMVCNQRLVARVPPAEGQATPGKLARAAAFELLPGSPALWSLIRDDKLFQLPSLLQRGKGAGILRLNDSLADLVTRAEVSLEAALSVSDDPRELERILVGPTTIAQPDAPPAELPQGTLGGLINKAGAIFRRGGGST